MCFHRAKLIKKSECGTHSADKKQKLSTYRETRHFANAMLCAGGF
jgi:hypothetical protein